MYDQLDDETKGLFGHTHEHSGLDGQIFMPVFPSTINLSLWHNLTYSMNRDIGEIADM